MYKVEGNMIILVSFKLSLNPLKKKYVLTVHFYNVITIARTLFIFIG